MGGAGIPGGIRQNLKGNLYKVWNRMSSGSYFLPPVWLVEIPKENGGRRPLGIPTVADRVAQTVVKVVLEPLVEPVFHEDSYAYRGLIYCGMSSDLAVREFDTHFNSDQTGFSTVRRSLGAILKAELKLSARPRGTGTSRSSFTNYRFDPTGERRLTDWMQAHLRVRTWATRHYQALEAVLKPRLRPLLNLERWNPHNAAIRALRKSCADEARAAGR